MRHESQLTLKDKPQELYLWEYENIVTVTKLRMSVYKLLAAKVYINSFEEEKLKQFALVHFNE